MTVKAPLRPAPVQAEDLDPAVTVHMGSTAATDPGRRDEYDRAARARNMTPGQRRKAALDRERNRANLDIPAEIELVLQMLAADEMTSTSQMAVYMIALGLAEYQRVNGNLSWAKVPARSLRFEYNLTLPEIPAELKERARRFKKQRQQETQSGS